MLPAYASPVNPVDVTPVWSRFAELYPALTDILARSGEVDAVVPVLLQRAALDEATGAGAGARRCACCGPTACRCRCTCAGWRRGGPARRPTCSPQAGLPVFDWPARTARAAGLARRYALARDRVRPRAPAPAAYSGPVPAADDPAGVAAAAGAVRRADRCSRGLPHPGGGGERRDRVPGRRQDRRCRAPDRAGRGAARPAGRRCGAGRGGDLLVSTDAVLVQPQLTGVEVVVGGIRDAAFGPVVMVGLGGIWVEALADVAFALAPLSAEEAGELISSLRGYAVLAGGRGGPAVDLAALARVVVAAGNVLATVSEIAALDLNPVLATPDGAVAVDWKITLTTSP